MKIKMKKKKIQAITLTLIKNMDETEAMENIWILTVGHVSFSYDSFVLDSSDLFNNTIEIATVII